MKTARAGGCCVTWPAGAAGAKLNEPGEPSADEATIARLSRRETQVLELTAEGYSVDECAGRLGLSPGTVDNFKTRMMKKLDIHKSAGLVRLAVRERLVPE